VDRCESARCKLKLIRGSGRLAQALVRMVQVFRILVVFSIAALGVAVFLPFAHPVQIHVKLNEPMPFLWLGPTLLVSTIAILVAAVALLFFRRWGQWLGVFVLLAGIAAYWSALAVGFGSALAMSAQVLIALSALAWLACLLVSRRPTVAAMFQHAH